MRPTGSTALIRRFWFDHRCYAVDGVAELAGCGFGLTAREIVEVFCGGGEVADRLGGAFQFGGRHRRFLSRVSLEGDVVCDGCQTSAANDNLRLSLYPASAVTGEFIDAGEIMRGTSHQLEGTGTLAVTAFHGIEAGDYVIAVATPYPVELGGACRVSAAETVKPKHGATRLAPFPERYPYIWPIVRVWVPTSTNPAVYMNCR